MTPTDIPREIPWDLENDSIASIYPKGNRPEIELPIGISFVLNISRIDSQVQHEIAPGHELRRATTAEILAIKDVIKGFKTTNSWDPWEGGKWVKNADGGSSRSRLPREEWRYFVISFKGPNRIVSRLERAFSIAPVDLKIGFTVLPEAFPKTRVPVLIYSPGRLFSQLSRMESGELPIFEIKEDVASTVRELHKQLCQHDKALVDVERLARALLEFDALPWDSNLLFVGHFAILESLLTHQPKPSDTIDSITRQVKRKIALLDNRWVPPIDYSAFQKSKPETIWSAMYGYRSCLAHGSTPDFKNDLKILGDPATALALLRQTVKSVLRQALVEPQLITDLRNC